MAVEPNPVCDMRQSAERKSRAFKLGSFMFSKPTHLFLDRCELNIPDRNALYRTAHYIHDILVLPHEEMTIRLSHSK